ncbi:MAG TPA: nitrous oxide reductase accessory protein NosL [Saprospiraceae bacterium]|nr:nitrous oxide reductase accessory protein NosL [Saprospiraceae bacterium]HMU02145.1 nitrous oxide reductase accessory protein NosL [Saprospiraceae bacterium]
MSTFSKYSVPMLILSGICILSAIVFPIWRIELDAPQYPEGLALHIYANRMGGDVDIINGLNHYIGMKTIHAEEFIEFTVLPYIIGFFGLWALFSAYLKSKRSVLILLIFFGLFGVLAMYDFWRWEYEYGHNLDPTAAIIVPGMAYQPPLIGFKQLLNFGAYSIPDIGGWLLLLGGVLIATVYVIEAGLLNKFIKSKPKTAIWILPILFLLSCTPEGPEPILLNKDTCAFCKMNISDGHFGAELITSKGRIFKFDDISCMVAFKQENPDKAVKSHFVHDYTGNNELIPAENASYISGGTLKSPMAGNIAAFKSDAEASEYLIKTEATKTDWATINQRK